jgi:hypothetical protein
MKMTVFWDFAPSFTSEASVNFYETTRRNIPEDICLHLQISLRKTAGSKHDGIIGYPEDSPVYFSMFRKPQG